MKTSTLLTRAYSYALAAFFVCFCIPANAQRINQYTQSTFTSTFQSLNGQSGVSTIVTFTGNTISGVYSMTMPFAFKYDNVMRASGATLYVHVAGQVSFVSFSSSYNNVITPSNASYNNAIAPLSGLKATVSGSKIMYATTGTAPNRVLTVEWYRFGDYPSQSQGNVNFQTKLYETSGTIEFLYEKYNFSVTNSSYSSYTKGVGLTGHTSPTFIQRVTISSTLSTPASNYRYSNLPDIQLAVTPKLLNFGQQLQGNVVDLTVSLTHVGTEGMLNITSATVNGPIAGEFEIIDPVVPPTDIPLGGTVVYTIRYTAQVPGPRAASVTFASNGRDSGVQSVGLTAYGIAPEVGASTNLLFKGVRQKLGQSIEQSVVITSKTTAPLIFINYPNSFVISGDDAGDYEITRMPMNPLPGGMSDTLTVRFTPTTEGGHLATLTISSNAYNLPTIPVSLKGTGILPRIAVSPESIQFDSVTIGDTRTEKFTIYNPGSDTLVITNNFFSSADADFSLVALEGTATIIPPERSREVGVTFTPLQRGARAARYRVMTNIPLTFEDPRRDTATEALYFEIQGTGTPVGTLISSVGTNIADSSLIGAKLCREVTITNDGEADITITNTSFAGSSAADYQLSGVTLPHTLKPGNAVTVTVCATPLERGSRAVDLTVTGTTNGLTKNLTIAVDVKGLLACATPAPLVAFENAVLPHTKSETAQITVTNCGDVPAVYTATLSTNPETAYAVVPATSASVDPGMTATFDVTFTPTTSGVKAGTLTITSPNVAAMNIDLQGTGACAILDALATVEAPTTPAGSQQQFTVTINNTGNLTWDPGTPVITPSDAFSYVSGATPIAANGNGTLTLSYNPPSMTTHLAQITFPNAKECGNAITINLTGSAGVGAVKDVRTPDGFVLSQNAPNPTQGMTNFSYTLPRAAKVRIVVADVTGKTVRELVNTNAGAGTYQVDVNTAGLASGTYLYILEADDARLVRQMVIKK